jgi:hypothetical protein
MMMTMITAKMVTLAKMTVITKTIGNIFSDNTIFSSTRTASSDHLHTVAFSVWHCTPSTMGL